MTDVQAPPAVATSASLPGDEHYARNLIGGSWEFPAAPFEFEIRNPLDSTVTTVVPLSSRFDVARAVAAAQAAAPQWAADGSLRHQLLARLVSEVEAAAGPLAQLQALETGLALADSQDTVLGVARFARCLLSGAATDPGRAAPPGVSGHVLSWGLPFAEMSCGVLPDLLAGRAVVVKPSCARRYRPWPWPTWPRGWGSRRV